jgi:hypothetical protein
MNPQIASQIRLGITLICGLLVMHGYSKYATVLNSEDSIGLILWIANMIWTWWENRPKSLVQKAADSLPPNTVIPATTDAAPKAQIISPESATDFIRNPSKAG